MFEDLKKQIDAHNIISFDIFDTLIIRAYDKPTDLFKHMEISLNCKNFAKERILAEQKARQKIICDTIEEITLDEIYNEIPKKFKHLKSVEIEQEYLACFADANMYEIFEYAKQQHKKICITSDMYLPINVIEKILKENGYDGYQKLFLSSETKKTKINKSIFYDIMDYFNISANQILHIGDNYVSDYEIPRDIKIDAYYYSKASSIDGYDKDYRFFKWLDTNTDKISISLFKGLLIRYNQTHVSSWEKFGYQYAGLMTVAFCNWLKQEFDQDKITKAFFITRDGYIPKKVFNVLYPEFKTEYMYGSRRCYIFAGAKNLEDIYTYLVDFGTDGCTFKEYWKALSIDDKDFYNEYLKAFPNQEEKLTLGNKQKIKDFFQRNKPFIDKLISKEKALSRQYLDSIKLTSEKSALIDIGWRASIQKNIERILNSYNLKYNIRGYYFGTHPYSGITTPVKGFVLNQSIPQENNAIVADVLNFLELIYTSPELGVVKIAQDSNKTLTAIRQRSTDNEKIRAQASTGILKGVLEFVHDWEYITKQLKVKISPEETLVALNKLVYRLNTDTYNLLKQVSYTAQIGDSNQLEGLLPNFPKERSFGVIYTFPGTEMAEKEAILRLKKAASNIGYNMVILNSQGYCLNSEMGGTFKRIRDDDLEFIITTHFMDTKFFDTFYYHALWNPKETSLSSDNYRMYIDNILSNDDFLIYDQGGMSNHLKSVLIDDQRDLERASQLVASCPKSVIMEPNLHNPKLFYCGTNWERTCNSSGLARHSGLFSLLDNCNVIEIYGPKKLPNWPIAPWDGYKSYNGEIPFDGFSILEKINQCGIVLALSSDVHRRAGAVTNRVYEACAAGAVIISDDNPFMKEHFEDTVLYIDFNINNPIDTYNQIMQKYNWIISHKDEAKELAKQSQNIFIKKFCLEKQLSDVWKEHNNRKRAIEKSMYAQNREEKILIIAYMDALIFDKDEKYKLKHIIDQINNQHYQNITLGIVCEEKNKDAILSCIGKNKYPIQIIPMQIYNKKNTKLITRCQMLREALHQIPCSYFCIMQGNEIFFHDHLEILKRKLEDNKEALAAYSGIFLDSHDGIRYIIRRNILHNISFYIMDFKVYGSMLFKKQIANMLPFYVDSSIDGFEVDALAQYIIFSKKKQIIYSDHMTAGINESISGQYVSPLLTQQMQNKFIHGLVHTGYEHWIADTTLPNVQNKVIEYLPVDKKAMKYVYKIGILYIKLKIMINNFKLLFAFSKKRHSKLKEKIKKLKAEKKQLKRMKQCI